MLYNKLKSSNQVKASYTSSRSQIDKKLWADNKLQRINIRLTNNIVPLINHPQSELNELRSKENLKTVR